MQNEISIFTKNFISKRDDRRDDKVVTFEKLLLLLSFKDVPVLLNIKYKVLGSWQDFDVTRRWWQLSIRDKTQTYGEICLIQGD